MSAESIRGFKQLSPNTTESSNEGNRDLIATTLTGLLLDKGIEPAAVRALSETTIAGVVVNNYVQGNNYSTAGPYPIFAAETINREALRASERMGRREPTYTGTIHENRIITEGPYVLPDLSSSHLRSVRRNGASRIFVPGLADVQVPQAEETLGISEVPIAVVGAGAAGVLTARALTHLGFRSVTVLDKSGEAGGIWNRSDVANGSKNNPFDIVFGGHSVRAASKGLPERSGQTITGFIHNIAGVAIGGYHHEGTALSIEKAAVTSIEPGDLSHQVLIKKDGKEAITEYPIVVYAPGNGSPMPLSHKGHMETSATRSEAGIRWQKQLTPEKLRELEGKRLVFVGLGNSTAEMVYQIQQYENKTGRTIDYRIVTHYPDRSVYSPHEGYDGHAALYRDISKPELTRLAGDLPHIDSLFRQATAQGKVVADTRAWHIREGKFVAVSHDGIETVIPHDQVYTLIGYRQNPETLDKMGITVMDDYTGAAHFDYDGEVQAKPGVTGRERVYPGYFGIGPVLKTKYNPNALVIPGIQGTLNDLLPSLIFRATEYALRHPDRIAVHRATRIGREAVRKEAELARSTSKIPYLGGGSGNTSAVNDRRVELRSTTYELDRPPFALRREE